MAVRAFILLAGVVTTVSALRLPAAVHSSCTSSSCWRRHSVRMGLGDMFKKAFSNQDYSSSPATYEQTNARALHVLVDSEEKAQSIKAEIDAGLDFMEAAIKYSTCSSAARGGDLGKFTPGQMVKEFDDVVFSVEDTGQINMKNNAYIYEAKYGLNEVHGPVKTKFGYHLIKIIKRNIADFDFRMKEEPTVEL